MTSAMCDSYTIPSPELMLDARIASHGVVMPQGAQGLGLSSMQKASRSQGLTD